MRGSSSRLEWCGQPDTSRRRFWTWLVVSCVLHTPFTPLVVLFGLVRFFDRPTDTAPPAPPISEIPIDLLPADELEPPAPARAPPAEPGAQAVATKPMAPPHSAMEADAALSDAADAQVDAAPDDARTSDALFDVDSSDANALTDAGATPDADAMPDAGAPPDADTTPDDAGPMKNVDATAPRVASHASRDNDAGSSRPSEAEIGDPVALSGAAGKIADARATIRLILYTDRMRRHALGARLGSLLARAYQWRDFLGPGGIDPVRDVDRILIAGPELRDSSQVVAVLHYNIDEARMRAAIDALVRRDPSGRWLDSRVPAAHAHADRAERVFVFPAPNLVVVAPPSAERHALSLSPKTRFPNTSGSEVVSAYVVKPARALRMLPIRFPETVKWLKLKFVPSEDGGGVLHVVGRDTSAELATHNAELLEGAITAISNLDLGLLGMLFGGGSGLRFLERVHFEAQGTEIRGQVVVTAQQLARVVDLLGQLMGGAPRARPPPPVEEPTPPAVPEPAAPAPPP